MARWHTSNEGAYRSLDLGATAVDLTRWRDDDRATLSGGLLILGFAHGVRRSLPSHLERFPASPLPCHHDS